MTESTEPRAAAIEMALDDLLCDCDFERRLPTVAEIMERITIAPTAPGRVVIDASDARWIDSHLCAALHMQPEGAYRTEMEGVWRRVMAIVDQPATITPNTPGRVVISAKTVQTALIWANYADAKEVGWDERDQAAYDELIAAERAASGEQP